MMPEQTQTYRVEPKYEQFITDFPDFASLSCAPLRDVLAVWQGLGYNRRGKALHDIAHKVMSEFHGHLPQEPAVLETLPGIGKATAASICAFAFNKPTVFIETNIRTVFIHSFFKDQQGISDKELVPLVAATVDTQHPREWYYALMDYGVYLKKMVPNPSRRSKHHTQQSRFEGSDRQIRGAIIKFLTQNPYMTRTELIAVIQKDATRINTIIDQLCVEALIVQSDDKIRIA